MAAEAKEEDLNGPITQVRFNIKALFFVFMAGHQI
jgi:hypothetical protein